MLPNSNNNPNHIIINTQKYVYEGASLNGFDKVLKSNSNAKLIEVALNENTYAQLDLGNSANSDAGANSIKSTDISVKIAGANSIKSTDISSDIAGANSIKSTDISSDIAGANSIKPTNISSDIAGANSIKSTDMSVKIAGANSIKSTNISSDIAAANSSNSIDKNNSTTLFNSSLDAKKESEYSSITSTTSDSKIKLGESFSWGGYFQAIGVLFLLLGILCVVLWVMRKYGKFNFLPNPSELPKNALCLEAQLPLGPRKGLSVVRYLDKRLLLGITDQQITLLSESKVNSDTDEKDFKELFAAEQRQNEAK